MAGGGGNVAPYSRAVGFIYLFNLIVGVGALTLPLVFQQAGFVLGIFLLALLAVLSYIGVTFMIEAMAAANAELAMTEFQQIVGSPVSYKGKSDDQDEDMLTVPTERDHLIRNKTYEERLYEIRRRTEFGTIARLFFPPVGQVLMYAALILYLYGDLAIYGSSVPVSAAFFTGNTSIVMGSLVWTNNWSDSNPICSDHTCVDIYYFYLVLFSLFVLPFCFFNFENTKPLQILTMATRNVALLSMIVISLIYVANGCQNSCRGSMSIEANGSCCPSMADLIASNSIVNFQGLPFLFGAAIYSFMCSHSLPSLLTPINDKSNLKSLILGDFALILVVYTVLCMSALFAFDASTLDASCSASSIHPCKLQQLYTLNFISYDVHWLADFLVLFPVFTLTTNFPLICITLRNNLITLLETIIITIRVRRERKFDEVLTPYFSQGKDALHPAIRRGIMPLVAALPPLVIAFCTKDVDVLVGVTGSFAGICVIFVIPAAFVMSVRRKKGGHPRKSAERERRAAYFLENHHRSPFKSDGWAYLLCCAAVVSVPLAIWHLATA